MRKILLSAATFLTILAASAQVPSYVSTNGLVGYWPFNGNAQDASGNGNHGTVYGATLLTDRNSLTNSAYFFTTDNWSPGSQLSEIFIPYSPNISSPNISVMAWINPSTYGIQGSGATIISKFQQGYTNPNGQTWGLNLDNNNTGKINSTVYAPSTDNNQTYVNYLGNIIPLNGWSLVGFSFDGTNLNTYINGVLSNTTSAPQGFQMNTLGTSGISVGVSDQANGFWNPFKGLIDDIGIWNRALTQQEITDLYNSQTCTTPTATITPQTNTTFCQGGSVNLNASTGTNYTYEWYNNGNIINNATSNVYNATSSGNYTVKVTDGACNATSTIKTVTVNTIPNVTLNVLNNVIYKTSLPVQLVGNPSGGTYSGDAITGSTFTPANAPLGKKTISYNYTSQQGCSDSASQTTIVVDSVGNVCSTYDTLKIKVKFTLGLYANTTNTIKFYPNPTKDILFIDNGNYQAMNGYSIKIVSLTGAVVYNQLITSQQVQISMNQFATKGLYIAQILDSNNTIVDSKKIVLE